MFSGTSETGSVSTYSVSGYQSMLSMTSNDKAEVGVRVGMISPQTKKPSLIVLKGKLGLPEGFGPLKPYQRLQAKIDEENALNPKEDDFEETTMQLTSAALNNLRISTAKAEKEKIKAAKSKFKFKGGRLGRVKEGEEDDSENGHDSEGDSGRDDGKEGDDDDDDDSDYEGETETVNTTASIMRLRGETPEQRKIRKNLVSTTNSSVIDNSIRMI